MPKSHEVRLTVVGTDLFAAEIHAGSDAARVDWRSDYDALTYDVSKVPDDVRTGVLGWLEHFRLNFDAFDFAVTPSGDWVGDVRVQPVRRVVLDPEQDGPAHRRAPR
ncbi:hypothetical protein [Streptomyces yerevanensis]|uniref:hypothetical protein n=1 Tax=Streptomyces yerevanensis TaxID=66378 RepID=UPI003CCB87B7